VDPGDQRERRAIALIDLSPIMDSRPAYARSGDKTAPAFHFTAEALAGCKRLRTGAQ